MERGYECDIIYSCSWHSNSNYSMRSDTNSSRERERCMPSDGWQHDEQSQKAFSDMLSAYFLIYLTMWLIQFFKCFGEILINLHILWKFCFSNIVLTCNGLQKWHNRFGVDANQDQIIPATEEASAPFYVDRNNMTVMLYLSFYTRWQYPICACQIINL